MRIAVFSDTHLGIRQYGLKEREEDFYDQYFSAIDLCVEENVDAVIIAGDIFDQPRPSPKALKVFDEGMQILYKNDIHLLNVVGNHAMIQSPGFITADEFLFYVGNDASRKCILLDLEHDAYYCDDNTAIFGLPFHFNFEIDKLKSNIKKIIENAKNLGRKHNILVLHQSFKEYCGFTGEELSIDDIDTDFFDLIICGHIHEKLLTELSNGTIFLQPGSLERLNIAEARDEDRQGKGVFIIDTNNLTIDAIANGFKRIKNRRYFLLANMSINDVSDIDNLKQDLISVTKDYSYAPVVFLTIHDITNSFRVLVDMTKDLKKYCLTVRLDYIDESQKYDTQLITDTKDIPGPREALKLALNPSDDDQTKLCLDLFDELSKGHDVSGLLDEYYTKHYENNISENVIDDKGLIKFKEFFDNL